MTETPAIMICGHGSRDNAAVEEFSLLATRLKERFPDNRVESGFLEFATPIIRTGLEKLRDDGAKQILCVPGMLFAAGHVKNDLPSEVNNFKHANPELDVRFGRDLAIDTRLLDAAKARIEEAAGHLSAEERKETLLMVVGRGTNDPDANSNVSKVMRMLWEGMGFGWGEVCYSGVAFPRVPEGLQNAAKLGYKRIVVFPYFLFTGVLVRRIYDQTDEVAASHPDIQFLKAPYLKDHPKVIDTFVTRVEEILTGENNMNCSLCKYREQIIGYEDDQGTVQVGHHHHVMGIGTDGHHHHHHGHDHGQGHHHHHHDHEKKAKA